MSSIAEAKRIIGDRPNSGDSDVNVFKKYDVPYWVLTGLVDEIDRLRSLAGAVTPGPSARQIIRERIARLADGEVG